MEKRITQETFNQVVDENMTEFDMPREEALRDAIQQFIRQGVNLENIDLSGGEGRDQVLRLVALFKDQSQLLVSGNPELNEAEIVDILKALCDVCGAKHPQSKRNLNIFYETIDALNSVHAALKATVQRPKLAAALFNFLGVVSKLHVPTRDFFEPGGSELVVSHVRNSLERSDLVDQIEVCILGLKVAKIVSKSENNKVALMKAGLGALLVKIVTTPTDSHVDAEGSPLSQLKVEALICVRGLCIHDDTRKETSCAFDNGRYFTSAPAFVAALLADASTFQTHPELASTALSAARSLVTTEEAVKLVAMHGALELPQAVLRFAEAPVGLVRSTLGLARNLCADDVRKDRLVGDGTMHLIIRAVCSDAYIPDAQLVEHGVACLAAMSLRSPSNSYALVAAGAVQALTKVMKNHSDKSSVLRQCCLTVRNIAARCVDLRETILDAGLEGPLRQAGRFRDVVDEAYGALRDLGCAATVVKVAEDGQVVGQAFEQFGGGGGGGGGEGDGGAGTSAVTAGVKARFNPVFEESVDILARMQRESRAPLPQPPSDAEIRARQTSHRSVLDDGDESEDDAIIEADARSHEHEHVHEHEHEHEHNHEHGSCCGDDVRSGSGDAAHEHEHAHEH